MTPSEQQRLAELRIIIDNVEQVGDEWPALPWIKFLLRLLDEMTIERNGYGDRCQELQSKLDAATRSCINDF